MGAQCDAALKELIKEGSQWGVYLVTSPDPVAGGNLYSSDDDILGDPCDGEEEARRQILELVGSADSGPYAYQVECVDARRIVNAPVAINDETGRVYYAHPIGWTAAFDSRARKILAAAIEEDKAADDDPSRADCPADEMLDDLLDDLWEELS